MKRNLLIVISIILILAIGSWLFLQKTQNLKNTSNWPWKEYSQNFANVDCSKVPETQTARPNSDIIQTLRSICWQDRAWYENNWEYCNNLDNFWANSCLEWMAIKLKNNNVCKSPKIKDIQNCNKLVEETSTENTWHFKDYINKGINPL